MVAYVANLTGWRDFGECRTGAVLTEDGSVAAGLVFHNWNPDAGVIEVSGAAEHPGFAQRGVMAEIARYVFGGCGCQMLVARCHEGNEGVRRLFRAAGASEFIIPRLRGRDAAECILTLTDDAWRASRFAR